LFFMALFITYSYLIVEYLFAWLIYNSSIPYEATIDEGTKLGYGGIGVVLHRKVVIGKNVMIGQHVTIGGRSGLSQFPVVGDNVFIGPGVSILGDLRVGNNVTIGANSVVLNDVPDNAVVVGVPAKIIKYHKTIKNIYSDH